MNGEKVVAGQRPARHQPPFSPIRSGPKAASKPSRQKQFPSSNKLEYDCRVDILAPRRTP